MLRITKQTDYAVLLLVEVASKGGGPYTAKQLAFETNVSHPMTSKILKRLSRAGLLASTRGATGGYTLARPPTEISMSEIIDALEGPIGVTDCISATRDCSRDSECGLRRGWRKIDEKLRSVLDEVTLADMYRAAQGG